MGCGESKQVQKISVQGTPHDPLPTISQGHDSDRIVSGGSMMSSGTEDLPNHILECSDTLKNVRNCDLGESLDGRPGKLLMDSHSASSTDSGVYDLEQEYSHVITENSAAELVAQVERDFSPIDDADHLVVLGKACPRLLSGSQRTRMEEQEILLSLREEGLITTSSTKGAKGLSFQIVEMENERNNLQSSHGSLPPLRLQKMEKRRKKHQTEITEQTLEEKLQAASERKKMLEEEKLKRVSQVGRLNEDVIEKRVQSARQKQEMKESAAAENRAQRMRELRDKLKTKNKRVAEVKLKKSIKEGVPVKNTKPDIFTIHRESDEEDFFA